MDQQTVPGLEDEIERAVAEIVVGLGLKRLPVLPSQRTMHLMAKAAVAVYEAIAEPQEPRLEDRDEQRPES